MKTIELPPIREFLREGYRYTDNTLMMPSGVSVQSTYGCNSQMKARLDSVEYSASRVAFLLAHGRPPQGRIRFLNGDARDLSKGNMADGYSQGTLKKTSPRYAKKTITQEHNIPYVYWNDSARGYHVQVYYQGATYYVHYTKDLKEAHQVAYLVDSTVFPDYVKVPPVGVPSYINNNEKIQRRISKLKDKVNDNNSNL